MGVTNIGVGDNNVIFKRKFRWTFEVESIGGCEFRVPAHFCKLAARPNISIEETEINFLNDKTWIPGKAAWESITITYLDVGGVGLQDEGQLGVRGIYQWLAAVYDFTGQGQPRRGMSSKRAGYSGKGTLKLYDGCGNTMETWILEDCWPQAINFGDLDYSSSDTVDIELTIRYSKVKVTFDCPSDAFQPCCEGC